ncbi:hypothetical protein BGW80DRAFT_1338670 [Lactifluus volemus]|nr:hypothetical protein BGW80DRAFT_1338670 [Lactifluus volemus]
MANTICAERRTTCGMEREYRSLHCTTALRHYSISFCKKHNAQGHPYWTEGCCL